jgi:hypothetical protein
MSAKEIDVVRDIQPPARQQAATPMEMLQHALMNGASPEMMEKLLTLQERWEGNQARKAFDAAMAEAKSDLPVIVRNRAVDFTTQKGRTNYKFEDLAEIARAVDPVLTSHGLSYRYRTKTENGQVSVTCIIAHRDGYSEETTLSAPHDLSGNKNAIQAVGSAITYLQRYTLKAALGLSVSHDDDAQTAARRQDDFGLPVDCITPAQVDELRGLIDEVGGDVRKLCAYYRIDSLADLPAVRFQRVKLAIEKKGQRHD